MAIKTGVPQLDHLAAAATSGSFETTAITLGFVVLSVIFCFFKFVKQSSSNFPVLRVADIASTKKGLPKSPDSLAWPRLLKEGADKYGKPFVVKFPDMGPTTILPPKYIADIKNNKDLSLDATSKKDFFPDYPGFEAMKAGAVQNMGHTFHDAVRVKLTQALTFFTESLSDEANQALPELFPEKDGKCCSECTAPERKTLTSGKEWDSKMIYPNVLSLVTRLSSLIFLGRDFDSLKEWQDISASYTVNLFNAARILRQWNPWLRPVVHWFLPETTKLRAQVKTARSLIEPEVARRRLRRQEALKNGTQPRKSLDSVDWFEETAKGRDFDFVAGELLLSVVAIHTTTGTLTNAILDVCDNPELIQPLRDEIISVINEDGGLERTSLHKLKLMDSVLKESQRLHPLGQANLRRQAMKDIKLHDGAILPKGSFTMSGPSLNYDEKTYPNPYKFDGYRFLNLRQRPGEENKWNFVATQPEHMGFGYGMHACPGRFFASNEIKIGLMHMLMKYDWRFPVDGDGKRPHSLELGLETPPNPTAKLEFKARTSEVSF